MLLKRAVVWPVAGLHVLWGVLYVLDPTIRPIPLEPFHSVSGVSGAVILIGASAAAIVATTRRGIAAVGYLLPQQILLLMSAGSALWFSASGMYADGVVRASQFILADQAPMIALAIAHTAILASWMRVAR